MTDMKLECIGMNFVHCDLRFSCTQRVKILLWELVHSQESFRQRAKFTTCRVTGSACTPITSNHTSKLGKTLPRLLPVLRTCMHDMTGLTAMTRLGP
jgi:hypothetical protein